MSKNVHDGHRGRMKERFYNTGLDGFADHEILEFILFFVIPLKDTNKIAHGLLAHFGSLSGVLLATNKELQQVDGIGSQAATLVSLFAPVARRLFTGDEPMTSIDTSNAAAKYVISLFYGMRKECLYLICMDSSYRVLHQQVMVEGSIDNLPVYPREIAAVTLRHNATHVILAHNHPGGNPQPSRQDIVITLDIVKALSPLGIQLCDHIIVSGRDYYSFSEKQAYTHSFTESDPLFIGDSSATSYAAQEQSGEI